jgi:hypothetical protein
MTGICRFFHKLSIVVNFAFGSLIYESNCCSITYPLRLRRKYTWGIYYFNLEGCQIEAVRRNIRVTKSLDSNYFLGVAEANWSMSFPYHFVRHYIGSKRRMGNITNLSVGSDHGRGCASRRVHRYCSDF